MRFVDAHYIPYTPGKYLSYDDVLLLPKISTVESRNDPRLNTKAKIAIDLELKIPLISSPMSTVTESAMAIALRKAGGLGILHRFYASREAQIADIIKVQSETGEVAFSIGLDQGDIELVHEVTDRFGKAVVCVDTAHGGLKKSLDQVYRLANKFDQKIRIIAGNTATPPELAALIKAGAHAVRVGIGPGSLCSTRMIAGIGVSQLTAIIQARETVSGLQSNCKIIADGGIRYPGDAVKALAAGADCVMIGNLFAGTDESPGEIQETNGKRWKRYYGQSSQEFLNLIKKKGVTAEGSSMDIPYRGSVNDAIEYLMGGIRSGMSYCGVYNLDDLYENATFIEISHAGQIESRPHGTFNSY